MSLTQVRTVNFGKNKSNATGSSGVGYTVFDSVGVVNAPRTTTGVTQLASGSGIYQAPISFPDTFKGSVLWDTGVAFPTTYYATEQYNSEENNPNVDVILSMTTQISSSVEIIRGMTEGRWYIDENTNKMFFYDKDNTTLIAEYNLKDKDGLPTVDAVFERLRA